MTAAYPTPEEIWQVYTGGEDVRDFIARLAATSAEACVSAHLDALPDVYGILRANNWRLSFSRPWQLRRNEVAWGLLAYLEQHQDAWWDALRVEENLELTNPGSLEVNAGAQAEALENLEI